MLIDNMQTVKRLEEIKSRGEGSVDIRRASSCGIRKYHKEVQMTLSDTIDIFLNRG